MVQAYLLIISCPTHLPVRAFHIRYGLMFGPFAICYFFPTLGCYENLAFVTQRYDMMARHFRLISDYIGAYKSPFFHLNCYTTIREGSDFNGSNRFLF